MELEWGTNLAAGTALVAGRRVAEREEQRQAALWSTRLEQARCVSNESIEETFLHRQGRFFCWSKT